MPTTYAHDLFGKTVYKKLDSEIKELIARHSMAYTVGLHGPDILFYVRPFQKNRINELGQKLHQEEAAGFFARGGVLYRETKDEGVLAYLLGFVCHFMLDSTCHPYIGEYMKKTGAGHDEIETELDRALMEEQGKNPFYYHPACVIHPTADCVHSIAAVLPEVTEKEVRHMLRAMKFYTGFTVCSSALKRKFLLGASKALGAYGLVQGRIMRKEPRPICQESTKELKRLFGLAVPETVTVLERYYRCVLSGEEPEARFNRNYN
ncbi:zinc dependent phospholipase C family protein [Marvinbryantia formatexigens]|nr:zinc dependent phospholipase C family protein [Marvinbryantia formatexigens]UWO25478.1 zinc dependent phospholipase C family protein [Marvinbryantia formatexigens DSM 14469]SDG91277.1 Zinc dependent phospholipase C [Marvinbryantia formatexigens]